MKKWLIIPLLFLAGCNPKVVSYLNSKSNFRSFETYRIVSPKVDNNKIDREMSFVFDAIKQNITDEMSRRNYEQSSVSPDLTLRYELTSGTRTETTRQQSFYYPVYNLNTRTIHEAVLLLELYDQRNKLVWQGSYDLDQERKEKRANKVIATAIAKIFTTYPHVALSNEADPTLTEYVKKKQ